MSSKLRMRPGVSSISPEEAQKRLSLAADWVDGANLPMQSGAGEGAVFPWAGANDRVVYNLSLRLRESLYRKLKFLSENEPNVSMHQIAIEGTEKEIARRLRKYEAAAKSSAAG